MASLLVQATHVQFFNKDSLSDVEKGFLCCTSQVLDKMSVVDAFDCPS